MSSTLYVSKTPTLGNISDPNDQAEQYIPINKLRCFNNFYELEIGSVENWRWTGPGSSFSIFVPIASARPSHIVLECRDSTSPFNWDNIFMETAGVMTLCGHNDIDGLHKMTAPFPQESGENGAFVSYHLQETRRPPANPGGTQETRLLGLRVIGIRLIF